MLNSTAEKQKPIYENLILRIKNRKSNLDAIFILHKN